MINDETNGLNAKRLTMPTSMFNQHTITAPSTLCLRSTGPIVPIRPSAAAAFSESSSANTNPYNHEITQILPFLYLGSQNDALSKEKMKVC